MIGGEFIAMETHQFPINLADPSYFLCYFLCHMNYDLFYQWTKVTINSKRTTIRLLFLDFLGKSLILSVSHSRSINAFYLLLLVTAEFIDNRDGARRPSLSDFHAVVLIALHGARVELMVKDVAAINA